MNCADCSPEDQSRLWLALDLSKVDKSRVLNALKKWKEEDNHKLGLEKSQISRNLLKLKFKTHKEACVFRSHGITELRKVNVESSKIRCDWWRRRQFRQESNNKEK